MSLLKENKLRLPGQFGSYKLLEWKAEQKRKQYVSHMVAESLLDLILFTGLIWLQELVGEAFTWSGGGSNDLVTGYFGDGQTCVGVEKETTRRSNL